jgi:hypothetical protein
VNVHHAPKVEQVRPSEPLLMNLLLRGIVDGQTSVGTISRWPTMHPESPLVCSTLAEMARGHRWTICVLPLAGKVLDRRAKGEVALLVLVVADAQAAVAEFWALVLEGSSYPQSRTLELMAEAVWKACVQVLPQSLIEDAPLALPSGASARVAAIQALHGCRDSHQIGTQVRRPMN